MTRMKNLYRRPALGSNKRRKGMRNPVPWDVVVMRRMNKGKFRPSK
jgi:hypothetical protein